MKTIRVTERSRDKHLHIEVPGCVVNIRTGLEDCGGRPVTVIAISCDTYAGEPGWALPDFDHARALTARVVRQE
jgi:hypothetical protein